MLYFSKAQTKEVVYLDLLCYINFISFGTSIFPVLPHLRVTFCFNKPLLFNSTEIYLFFIIMLLSADWVQRVDGTVCTDQTAD